MEATTGLPPGKKEDMFANCLYNRLYVRFRNSLQNISIKQSWYVIYWKEGELRCSSYMNELHGTKCKWNELITVVLLLWCPQDAQTLGDCRQLRYTCIDCRNYYRNWVRQQARFHTSNLLFQSLLALNIQCFCTLNVGMVYTKVPGPKKPQNRTLRVLMWHHFLAKSHQS